MPGLQAAQRTGRRARSWKQDRRCLRAYPRQLRVRESSTINFRPLPGVVDTRKLAEDTCRSWMLGYLTRKPPLILVLLQMVPHQGRHLLETGRCCTLTLA